MEIALASEPFTFYHQILIITISITLYDYLPERFSAISYPPTIGVTSCVSSTIIRVQLLVPKVFPAFKIDGIGFQRLRYHIDLHDCKVIGLRWLQEANLLYDKGEASADVAWKTMSLGS